jgi:hypothetical protein
MVKEVMVAAAARQPDLIHIRRSVDSSEDDGPRPSMAALNADMSDSDGPPTKNMITRTAKSKGKGKEKVVDKEGNSEDYEMGELEEEMANAKIVVKQRPAAAATSGRGGRRIRTPQPTGELFARPCKRCSNAQVHTPCEVNEKGGACVRCKARKYKCNHAFKQGPVKKSRAMVAYDDDSNVGPTHSEPERTPKPAAAKARKTIRFAVPEDDASNVGPSSSAPTRPVSKARAAPRRKTSGKFLPILSFSLVYTHLYQGRFAWWRKM